MAIELLKESDPKKVEAWDRKLGEFNFKIEFNKEYDEIQLRLWKRE